VVVVALGALGIFGVYAWSARYWVDLTDEGYFLYLASRVYQGDLPYRDFDTYYTPGVFYLYAAAFKLFGVSIVPVRVLMCGVRVICALLLYGLTRRVAPWPFAILPFLALAAVDPMPVFPEPHPAWMAMAATLLTLETILRHDTSGRRRWIVLAGVVAGVAFLFKQNVGAFAALTVGGYVVFRPRPNAGWLMMAAQALFAIVLALAVTVLLWPALDDLVTAAIWLPVIATLGLLLALRWHEQRPDHWTAGLRALMIEGLTAGAAFVVVTLLWLVPLTFALGPRDVPWGLFVGAVNQGALIYPLEPPPRVARELGLVAIWLPIGVAAVCGVLGGRTKRGLRSSVVRRPSSVVLPVILSLLLPLMPVVTRLPEELVEDPSFYPWLGILNAQLDSLYLYLPALGAWGALAALRFLPWYLLAGTLAALAVHPRVDALHAMFAGPPLFVVGAWALWRVHRALVGGGNGATHIAVFATLLLVPVAAVSPHAYWRYVTIVHSDPRAAEPPPYVPLGLDRAPVLAPQHVADNVRGAVELVRANTEPGEPFFAYPMVPLFNFLADRPNPTRFDHFLPGALMTEDLDQVIDNLEQARPRYVLWDHGGVAYWKTDLTNGILSDYIWRCYEQVANFPPYLILERRRC
jgi:hypothetical protein